MAELRALSDFRRRLAYLIFWRVGDIAEHLGVSERRAKALTRREGFPAPFGTTPFTRIWAAEDVQEFMACLPERLPVQV